MVISTYLKNIYTAFMGQPKVQTEKPKEAQYRHPITGEPMSYDPYGPGYKNAMRMGFGRPSSHHENCDCTEADLDLYQKLIKAAVNEVQPFDWANWSVLKDFTKDNSILEKLSREDLLKLVIAHLRAERFCSGVLDTAYDNGVMKRIALRVQKLS